MCMIEVLFGPAENCCIQESFHAVAANGVVHESGATGGLKRPGGDFANGIPRNSLTEAVADGKVAVVPITIPELIVTVGCDIALTKQSQTESNKYFSVIRSLIIGNVHVMK
jgi:hypothetical protein